MKTPVLLTYIFTVALLLLSSCGPVHRFTRVKKVPREYSLNYCGSNVKAPKTDFNKEPWIVFSDRAENQSYNNAGGSVKAKDVDYLDPFLVIGRRGEYLKLIKYTPDILKNGKLEYKQAEYYGWMHESKLLLNRQSVTDIAGGTKNKMLAMFSDTAVINEPQKYFATDSLKLYKDPELKAQVGVLSPFSVVYRMKQSQNGSMSLIAKKTLVNADEVKEDILGWIDNSLITDIGTRLHLNLYSLPAYQNRFATSKGHAVTLTKDMEDMISLLVDQYQTIKYSPVLSYSQRDSLNAFRTRVIQSVFDYSNNYIFNVKGGKITHREFRGIARNLKKINISFVFEGKDKAIEYFPQIVNALQNLQPMFEEQDASFSFLFNCVMTFDDNGKRLHPLSTEFTPEYSEVINYLSGKAGNKDRLRSLMLPRKWAGLRHAVNAFDKHKESTNLIVLMGETGLSESEIEPELINRMVSNNCRLIAFQIYAGEGDEYNNFVLDAENIITSYADTMLHTRQSLLVSPEQIRRSNEFVQPEEQENSYRLDFPANSITQGALFFPRKAGVLGMEVVPNNIDSIVRQIKEDNKSIAYYMSQAFRTAGNNRTRFDTLFVKNFAIDSSRVLQRKLSSSFVNETPGWYLPSEIIVLNDSTDNTLDYRLMLSEEEMKNLKEFIAALSEKEVDFIYYGQKREYPERKPCNCPDDDLFLELEKKKNAEEQKSVTKFADTYSQTYRLGYYVYTKNVRKHLSKLFLKPIKYCRICKEKGKVLKSMTLADAHFRITGCPTSTELLNSIRIQDLDSEDTLSDIKLEMLINYYKKMKKELDKAIQFESNGQIYYWVDRKLLP